MNRSIITRRVAPVLLLNAALAAILLTDFTSGTADAQAVPNRARGEYTMVAGRTNAGGPETVAILDATNQELVFVRWDQSRQQLNLIAYRSLNTDANADPGR